MVPIVLGDIERQLFERLVVSMEKLAAGVSKMAEESKRTNQLMAETNILMGTPDNDDIDNFEEDTEDDSGESI